LAFKHLDFDFWNLLRQLQKCGKARSLMNQATTKMWKGTKPDESGNYKNPEKERGRL
jgi:hypothetical protein